MPCISYAEFFMFRTLVLSAALLVVKFTPFTNAQEQPKAEEAKPARRVLVADYSKRRVAIVDATGKLEWEHKIADLHDLHALPNGNLLLQLSWTRIVEIDPRTSKIVWEYDSKNVNGQRRRAEVHAFQRLADGVTMIAESGRARLIEVDRDGKLVHEIKLKVANPDPHRDTRLVRKLENNHYLVCHEGEGAVREYDAAGKVVWDYEVPLFGQKPRGGHGAEAWGNAVFAALRLPNSNTLISTGNGHSVIEVTPEKKIVWHLQQDDLPGIKLAWVTTLQVLPDGNIVLGNCHAGPHNPQIIEITRTKRVVWTFRDFVNFGDATSNSVILDVKETPTITHGFLACGGQTYIRSGDGKIAWQYPHGSRDGWVLPNGNVLLALSNSKKYPGGGVIEVTREGKVLFEFKGTQAEVNTVQPVEKDRVLLTEAGPKPRLLEVNRQGEIVVEVPLQAQTKDHHLQSRMARKLANGNYLVPQLLDRVVREYTPAGKIAWEVKTPNMPFTAIRLDNGNTLIGCTLGHLVIEVDPAGKTVWQVSNDDLPGRPINDACGVQRLPNGNTVITSHHANGNDVKLTEVTPAKKIVWLHRDSQKPGIHHFQILDTDGKALEGRPLR